MKRIKISKLNGEIPKILEDIQKSLFERSKNLLKEKIEPADSLEELNNTIKNKKIALSPLCKSIKCEDLMKSKTDGAKTLFIEDKKKIR